MMATCNTMRIIFAFLFGLVLCGTTTLAQENANAPNNLAIPETDEGLPGTGPIRRYDWFKDLWNQRRTTWQQTAEFDQHAVVFLGDSITQGWGEDFDNVFKNVKLANRGISGDTTRGMLIRLEQDVLAIAPKAVVLLMGTNDLEEGADPESVRDNIGLIIAALEKHNKAMPIILCNVFPSSAQKKRPADKIKRINELVTDAVRGNGQVTVLDTWTLFADKNGDAKIEEFPDLLHPNSAGYQKWAGALVPVFETLGLTEPPQDDFKIEEGFTSLFNGTDLTGWGYRPTSAEQLRSRDGWKGRPEWPIITEPIDFTNTTASPDGRYIAKNGRLVVTTPAEGRKIQQIYTTNDIKGDFILKLQFRATPNADSGVFLRGPQLQCRDYLLAGPYSELQHYKALDWNDLTVEVKGGFARCSCNDEVIEPAFAVPAVGPIGFEGDRGQVEYRRIRIKLATTTTE